MAAGDSAMVSRRSLLFAWDVSPDQEEPWRRLLQELSDPRYGEHAQSRRRLGVTAVSVWLAPKPYGGGVAIVCLQAEDPERVLGELVASDVPFNSWCETQMRKLFGFDLAQSERLVEGELLFTWSEDDPQGEHEGPNYSG